MNRERKISLNVNNFSGVFEPCKSHYYMEANKERYSVWCGEVMKSRNSIGILIYPGNFHINKAQIACAFI